MQVNPEEFRRRFADLSDDALLEVERDDLTDVARDLYDAELSRRGLTPEVEAGASDPVRGQPGPEGDLVLAAELGSLQELAFARALLKSSDIPSYITPDFSGILAPTEADAKLYVPSSYLEQAQELLAAPLTDEELAAQAEAAAEEWEEGETEESEESDAEEGEDENLPS